VSKSNQPGSFGRNIIANWSAFLISAGVSFFLSPFVVKSLGNVSYGVWVLIGSLVGYLGLLDFGVRGAVTRFVARYHSENDPGECGRIVSAGILLFGSVGILVVLLAGALALFVTVVFNVPEELVSTARIIILLGALNIVVALMGGFLEGLLPGCRDSTCSAG
jgi:O-antigen/teichoic acid export membrane protein